MFLAVGAAWGVERPVDRQFWQDVAASNAVTWSAILSLDVEYQATVRAVENGRVLFERTSTGHRWIRLPDRQRLVLRDLDGRGRLVDRLIRDGRQYRLEHPVTLDLTTQPLRLCDDRPVHATILAPPPELMDELIPQNLERLYFLQAAPRMTLAELLAGRESQWATVSSSDEGELATVRVDLRPRDDATGAESFVVLTVDLGKGCLIQKAEMVEAAAAHSTVDGSPVPIRTIWEVHAWAQPDAGVWYPTEVTFGNYGRGGVTNFPVPHAGALSARCRWN